MRQKPLLNRLAVILRRPGFWILVGLFLSISFLEYTQLLRQTFLINLGLTRYTIERILYLLPVIWAAFLLGSKGGIGTSLLAVGSMLPRALFFSPNREDSLVEVFFIFVIGILVSFTFGALQNEKKRAAKLKAAHEELQVLLHQVTRAQEGERKRIARELHDDTVQSLIALCQKLDYTASNIENLPSRARANLDEIYQEANTIMKEVRRLVQDLRPAALDNLGLVSALRWLTSDMEKYCGVPIKLEIIGARRRFSNEIELLLFRIAQEALRNIWKHAQASSVRITLEFKEGKTVLSICDDGKGFSPLEISSLPRSDKLGLVGMQERANLFGGTLSIKSRPDKGTTIIVECPL